MPLVYGVVIIIEEKNSGATGRSIAAGRNDLRYCKMGKLTKFI